tara:strand:- start:1778 stop:2500 length:723 start_codon:yes stop_codon:yes gene_type:complete
VIEANISDQAGPYTVTLSETGDFYLSNDFPAVHAEVVILSDENGNRDTLKEVKPGSYQTTFIQGVRGVIYTLEVKYKGTSYMASSRIPDQIISIDSLYTEFLEESILQDEGYYASIYAQDLPNVENYYRYKVFVNGEVYIFDEDTDEEEEDDNLYLDQDKFFDGQYYNITFPQNLKLGDSVSVELYNINKASYDYYKTLIEAIGASGVAAPSNPISNFNNNALGNFNAYVFSRKTVRVEG